MPLLLTLGVAGGLTAYSGGLLHSVTQSRASTGTFHWSGSAFIKSCTTAREEYLAGRLVGTCCRHRAPWRNSLFWVYRTHAVNIRVECVLGGRWKKHMRRHQTYTQKGERTHTHGAWDKHTNRSLRLNGGRATKPQSVLHAVPLVAKLPKQQHQQLQISAGETRWLQQLNIPEAEQFVHLV